MLRETGGLAGEGAERGGRQTWGRGKRRARSESEAGRGGQRRQEESERGQSESRAATGVSAGLAEIERGLSAEQSAEGDAVLGICTLHRGETDVGARTLTRAEAERNAC